MATFIIVDAHGNQFGGTSTSEAEIAKMAQEKADDRGESVYYTTTEEGFEAVEVEPTALAAEVNTIVPHSEKHEAAARRRENEASAAALDAEAAAQAAAYEAEADARNAADAAAHERMMAREVP